MEHLKGLTHLRLLCLFDTQVTDAGLEHLKGLTRGLETLELSGTRVTDEGVKSFRQASAKLQNPPWVTAMFSEHPCA